VSDPWPVIVVGAGAAGLTAAIFAGRHLAGRGERVLLLETRAKPGAKIRVSGGGRCNVLPSRYELDDFHTAGSVKAMRNVLFSWPLAEVRGFFEEDLGVPLKVEPTGKVFPVSERPQEVVEALLRECARAGVELRAPFRVVAARRVSTLAAADGSEGAAGAGFELESERGDRASGRRVVLATGGLSLPKSGSDGGGLEIARALGHLVEPTYPALVPLLSGDLRWRELAGVGVRVRLRATEGDRVLEERAGDFLFTHRGFSGPVVLDLSRHLTAPGGAGRQLEVAWGALGEGEWDARLRRGGKESVLAVLRGALPRRLAEAITRLAGVPAERALAELPREERARLVGVLDHYRLPVAGDEGYATAEVTGGGIALGELHLKTLESRKVPGLHFCGEMVDVTGRIGGYNFLWAWVSGRRAGEGAAGGDTERAS
jgi:hypothetical protein